MQAMALEKTSHKSTRTCVGCGHKGAPEDFVRLVAFGSEVAVDVQDREQNVAAGRGAHVHPTSECLLRACKGGLNRSMRTAISTSANDLADQIVAQCDRRIAGLLLAAFRTRRLEIGDAAVNEVVTKGNASLLVVASDAGSVVSHGAIGGLVVEGRAVAWKSKEELGALLGREQVAICAVTDGRIADEIKRARGIACSTRITRREVR